MKKHKMRKWVKKLLGCLGFVLVSLLLTILIVYALISSHYQTLERYDDYAYETRVNGTD